MLIACWSSKGGSGTTVVAASLALLIARRSAGGALLADLGGDVPAVLGIATPPGPGIREWLAADGDVPDDALGRLEVEAAPSLALLAEGAAGAAPAPGNDRGEALAAALAADSRPVIVDCGAAREPAARAVAAGATVSLLVVRLCFLALRRAVEAPIRPTGVIVVSEGGRSLRVADVEEVLGVPVRAELPCCPEIARAVDAGLLSSRMPRQLERSLRQAA